MHQADSNTTTSRRALLKGLGAVPVAGALAAGTATAGCTITSSLLADADPIFAAIEAHKQAMKNTDAVWDRLHEVEKEADRAGLPHGILVPDYRNGASGNTCEKAVCVSQIEELIPASGFDNEKLRRCYIAGWAGKATSGTPS